MKFQETKGTQGVGINCGGAKGAFASGGKGGWAEIGGLKGKHRGGIARMRRIRRGAKMEGWARQRMGGAGGGGEETNRNGRYGDGRP